MWPKFNSFLYLVLEEIVYHSFSMYVFQENIFMSLELLFCLRWSGCSTTETATKCRKISV